MLSMSTRRHEYGRQTRDEAAEVRLLSTAPTPLLFALRFAFEDKLNLTNASHALPTSLVIAIW